MIYLSLKVGKEKGYLVVYHFEISLNKKGIENYMLDANLKPVKIGVCGRKSTTLLKNIPLRYQNNGGGI